MFSLTDEDLKLRILGCADGPASFNAEATRQGHTVISTDPLYACSGKDIRERIEQTYSEMLEQARKNQNEFVWNEFSSVEKLGEARRQAMEEFLADYEAGRTAGRYLTAGLPSLPFASGVFDLALCSHFLFLYSEQLNLNLQFHIQSVLELCRVAREVRIFPLLELGSRPSRHVAAVVAELQSCGFEAQDQQVNYEFQRGGNRMLRINQPRQGAGFGAGLTGAG